MLFNGNIMDIFDEAMKIEKEGEALYRSFVEAASDEGAAYIFSRLADQEKKHYAVFKNMKDALPAAFEKNASIKDVRDIFVGWKNTHARFNVKMDQAELYRKALDVEKESVRLYEDGAKKADDEKIKAVFLQIAAEEKTHQQVMENIIEFVTKPETWAENAEFGYRGEDYYL